MEKSWTDHAGDDAAGAFEAVRLLTAWPKDAVPVPQSLPSCKALVVEVRLEK